MALAAAPSVAIVQHAMGVRSVRPVRAAMRETMGFDPAQSAALFVGVRRFDSTTIAPVPYAVDDAVDLAWAFAMDPRVSLVDPKRIVLALSSAPLKTASQERLAELRKAGVTETAATRDEILDQLQRQTESVGRNGLLVIAFASHGYMQDGIPYVLAATSELENPATAISTIQILEAASTSQAARSLVLLDACRDRVKTGPRTLRADASSAAPLIGEMARTDGQAVLYAAAAGKYAYDDDQRRNGVFTAAVLDGLQCRAERDAQGLVTVDTLAAYVDQQVQAWVRKHRDPAEGISAIQVCMDGSTRRMPLASCPQMDFAQNAEPVLPRPARIDAHDASLTVYGDNGAELWKREVHGHIAQAALVDLDGDGRSEVVAGVTDGHIVAFTASGERKWDADTNAPGNYNAQQAARLAVTTVVGASLFRKKTRQIVALSSADDGSASRLSIIDHRGTLLSAYWHPGRLQEVFVASLTSRHAPKIIVTAQNHDIATLLSEHSPFDAEHGTFDGVFMFDPKRVRGEAPPYRGRLGFGSQLWYGIVQPAEQRIARVDIIDFDNDGRRDIAVHTSAGQIFHLDFEGKLLETEGRARAQFGLIASR
jgi:hypothetical protein